MLQRLSILLKVARVKSNIIRPSDLDFFRDRNRFNYHHISVATVE